METLEHQQSMAIDNRSSLEVTQSDIAHKHSEHVNGLVCFNSRDTLMGKIYAYLFNPTTHKFFKLPDPVTSLPNYTDESKDTCYLFGFDELTNEHKVLYIDVEFIKPPTNDLMIFSFSTSSWRNITVGMTARRWWFGTSLSVCLNSIIHLMLRNPLEILAFDLRTETFSVFNLPPEAAPETVLTSIYPYAQFVKVNGLLGVTCHDPWNVEDLNKVHIWILQDYEKRVWVRETVTFPPNSHIFNGEGGPYPFDSINMDEVIFTPRVFLSEDLITVPVYNIKTRCFKSIELTLRHRFLHSTSVHAEQIKCYVESLIPLPSESLRLEQMK